MGAFVDNLEQEKDKVALVIFRDKGFTAFHKEDGIYSGGTTSGYDRITPEVIKKFEDLKVPLVDASKLDVESGRLDRHLIQMPMVAADTVKKFEFPFYGMSYAPAEVVASLYEKMGAKLYNIKPVTLVPEMFRTMKQKEALLLAGFFSNNEDAVKEAMLSNLDRESKTHELPGGDKLEGTEIAQVFNALEDDFQNLSETHAKAETERRATPYSIGGDYKQKNPRHSELSEQTMVLEKALSHIDHMVAKTGYEAALVIAGEKTDKEAVAEVKAWCNNKISATLAEYKEKGLKNSRGGHKYYYDGLKEAKKVSDKIQKGFGLDQGLSR